jgi:hypothetical protein
MINYTFLFSISYPLPSTPYPLNDKPNRRTIQAENAAAAAGTGGEDRAVDR